MRGRFVTVEGGEGVGKSSFIRGLTAALQKQGRDVLASFEPGGTMIADKLREIFVKPPATERLTIETEFCLVSGARAQHVVHKIQPALQQGKWVVCDRFADSSRVYQGVIGGIARPILDMVIQLTTYNLQPDLTFLLDCDPQIALARIAKRLKELGREDHSRFDAASTSMHVKMREGFLALAEEFKSRFVIIDAAKSTDECVQEALGIMAERFKSEAD